MPQNVVPQATPLRPTRDEGGLAFLRVLLTSQHGTTTLGVDIDTRPPYYGVRFTVTGSAGQASYTYIPAGAPGGGVRVEPTNGQVLPPVPLAGRTPGVIGPPQGVLHNGSFGDP